MSDEYVEQQLFEFSHESLMYGVHVLERDRYKSLRSTCRFSRGPFNLKMVIKIRFRVTYSEEKIGYNFSFLIE